MGWTQNQSQSQWRTPEVRRIVKTIPNLGVLLSFILGFTATKHVDWEPKHDHCPTCLFLRMFSCHSFVTSTEILVRSDSSDHLVEIHHFLSGYHYSENNITLIPKKVIHNFRRQREQLCPWHPRISMQNMWSIEKCWAILDGDCREMIASCFGDHGTKFLKPYQPYQPYPKRESYWRFAWSGLLERKWNAERSAAAFQSLGLGLEKSQKLETPNLMVFFILFGERLTMGGGVVKGFILQGFASLYMSWCSWTTVHNSPW